VTTQKIIITAAVRSCDGNVSMFRLWDAEGLFRVSLLLRLCINCSSCSWTDDINCNYRQCSKQRQDFAVQMWTT